MGIYGWYLDDNNTSDREMRGRQLARRNAPDSRMSDSSYTDFTAQSDSSYTEFAGNPYDNMSARRMSGAGYADSEYTDFTNAGNNMYGNAAAPNQAVRNASVRRVARRPAESNVAVSAAPERHAVPDRSADRRAQAAAKKASPKKQPAKKANANANQPKKKKKNVAGRVVLAAFFVVAAFGALGAGSLFYLNGKKDHANLKKEVVLEAGSQIKIQDFFSDCPIDAKFVTDVSDIDTNIPAIYQLTVFYEKAFTEDVTLKIEDHTGPEGNPIAQTVYTTWKMPEAEDCVDGLYDLSGIAKIAYKEGTPSFTAGGEFPIPVVVTDMYGNDTVIKVPFTVVDDRTAPIIEGVHDIVINGDARDVDLLEGVFAYDDYDLDPVVRVNDSMVDYTKSGEYQFSYSAMDRAGNVSTMTARMTIKLPNSDKKVNSDKKSTDGSSTGSSSSSGSGSSGSGSSGSSGSGSSSSSASDLAENIMSSLWRSNNVETARAIFNWVHSHITYQTVNDYLSYEEAAYRGFSKRNGDCYVYFACAKMLLDCAGIPNMMVERFPVYSNGHYWNLVQLNGEWYHCDATVFRDHPSMYFMCTDDEIEDSHHHFNGALYPERAGGSSEYLNSDPTPTPEPTATPTPAPTDTPAPTPTDTPKTEPTDPNANDGGNQDAYIPDNPIDGEDGDTYERLPSQPGPNQDMPYVEYGDYIVQEW